MNKIQSSSSKILIQGIVNQRLSKSPEELDEIERAVDITGEMHLETMKMTKAGIKEQHIASRLLEISTSYGGYYLFPPIVTISWGNTAQSLLWEYTKER